MPLHRVAQIPCECGARGTGEKAGGAWESGDRPEWAAQTREAWMEAFQPKNTGETGGEQKSRLLQMSQKPLQRPSLSGRPIP